MGLRETQAEILDRWSGVPAALISVKILEFLASLPETELQVLTFRTLSHAAGRKFGDGELVAAINILAGSYLSFLNAHAFFIDADEHEYELDEEEFEEVRRTNEVVHPDTGELISDAAKHIVPFFVPTERFFKAVK